VSKDEVASPPKRGTWTQPDEYLGALARRRAFRRQREPARRTQPEAPQFLLSTLPFLALFAALAVITVGIVLAAWPGAQPQPVAERQPPEHELGVAPKGWFQEAQREMHRQAGARR
jgi:hypothetical protein